MLYRKIIAIYPALTKADFGRFGTIRLQDDGEGPYIAKWEHPTLAQPTQAQLDAIVIDPNAPVVPQTITPRQCRLILSAQGLLAQVEALIALSDEPTRITWEYALEFRRDDPLLDALGTQLGLTAQQIDDFFVAASQL
jgi:hypothetical protein